MAIPFAGDEKLGDIFTAMSFTPFRSLVFIIKLQIAIKLLNFGT